MEDEQIPGVRAVDASALRFFDAEEHALNFCTGVIRLRELSEFHSGGDRARSDPLEGRYVRPYRAVIESYGIELQSDEVRQLPPRQGIAFPVVSVGWSVFALSMSRESVDQSKMAREFGASYPVRVPSVNKLATAIWLRVREMGFPAGVRPLWIDTLPVEYDRHSIAAEEPEFDPQSYYKYKDRMHSYQSELRIALAVDYSASDTTPPSALTVDLGNVNCGVFHALDPIERID